MGIKWGMCPTSLDLSQEWLAQKILQHVVARWIRTSGFVNSHVYLYVQLVMICRKWAGLMGFISMFTLFKLIIKLIYRFDENDISIKAIPYFTASVWKTIFVFQAACSFQFLSMLCFCFNIVLVLNSFFSTLYHQKTFLRALVVSRSQLWCRQVCIVDTLIGSCCPPQPIFRLTWGSSHVDW